MKILKSYSLPNLICSSFCMGIMLASSAASAAQGGSTFGVNEGTVPGGIPQQFQADNIDLQFQSCTAQLPSKPGQAHETGYVLVSSYKEKANILESQINNKQENGYLIYGIYAFNATNTSVGGGPSGIPQYEVNDAAMALYLDPQSDTQVGAYGCEFVFAHFEDDIRIGVSENLLVGSKYDKSGFINGAIDIKFSNWQWDKMVPFTLFTPLTGMTFTAELKTLGEPLTVLKGINSTGDGVVVVNGLKSIGEGLVAIARKNFTDEKTNLGLNNLGDSMNSSYGLKSIGEGLAIAGLKSIGEGLTIYRSGGSGNITWGE
jgi:hypothetical protein